MNVALTRPCYLLEIAPAEPGEYPFVCSFPGHWATMRGVLRID